MNKLHVMVAFIAIAATGLSTYLVMEARLEREVAQTKVDALQKKYDELATSITERDERQLKSSGVTAKRVADIKTTGDILSDLKRAPVDLQLPAAMNPFIVKPSSTLPDAPSELMIPKENYVTLYKSLLQCAERDKEFATCQADKKDLTGQIATVKQQAQTWEQEVKGGSKLSRVWFALRVGGCGAIGTVPGLLSKNSNTAVGGAAITSAFCALTLKK
jgi:hypothetical protein